MVTWPLSHVVMEAQQPVWPRANPAREAVVDGVEAEGVGEDPADRHCLPKLLLPRAGIFNGEPAMAQSGPILRDHRTSATTLVRKQPLQPLHRRSLKYQLRRTN